MKTLFLLTITTFLFAQEPLQEGIERAFALEKNDSCDKAKKEAKAKYDVKDMDVGCLCEKSDSREWSCIARFLYLPKK
ncbi:MAG: hypothetical protein PHH41_09255 [Sulfurimonas sp.]|nr:hypothetical protein [Sulfurimonas sp.]MDD3061110.1 hypothetical protein [Sulfurimonas sp.]MDD5203315.1 hypothetical protein [Sulfurimonas sp.]